jgi:WD40 repeat protein
MNELKKKRHPILLFTGVFIVIIALTLIAHWQSALVRKVQFPLNNGVAYLYTRGNSLAAACHDDTLYVWDWRDLKAKPKIVEVQSDQAYVLESGLVASVRRTDPHTVAVTDLDNGKVNKKIPIMGENKRAYLVANRSSQVVVLTLVKAEDEVTSRGQEVILIDCDTGLVRPIAKLVEEGADRLMGAAISDDGWFVVLTGEKDSQGWAAMVDIKENRVAWVEQLPDLQKVRNAVFSTDGKVIYIRGTDSTVQIIDSPTGKVLKRLLPIKENKSTADDQHVQTLATSNDGRFMAASISGAVCVWDCTTERLIFSQWSGHKLVSGIAFSPDSRYLATSDTRQGGVINIWRIPKR